MRVVKKWATGKKKNRVPRAIRTNFQLSLHLFVFVAIYDVLRTVYQLTDSRNDFRLQENQLVHDFSCEFCVHKNAFLFFLIETVSAWKCMREKPYQKESRPVKMKIVPFFVFQFGFYKSMEKSQWDHFSFNCFSLHFFISKNFSTVCNNIAVAITSIPK